MNGRKRLIVVTVALALLALITYGSIPEETHATAPSGLISRWSGDGNANDPVGNNPGILVNGAAFAPGVVNQAFSFNGLQSYVRVPNAANLNPSGSFSIDAWILPTADTSGHIITKWGDGAEWPDQRSYAIRTLEGGGLEFAISDVAHQHDMAFHQFQSSSGVVKLNVWNHVTAVYDQPTGARRLYVNGLKVAEISDPPLTILASTADVSIGAALYSPSRDLGYPFSGRIDEVELFNRALSDWEVYSLCSAGRVVSCRLTMPPPSSEGPRAVAGTSLDKTGRPQLDGRLSSDPDNSPLSFTWQIAGQGASRNGPTVPLRSLAPGTYEATLTVSDGTLQSVDVLRFGLPNVRPQPTTNLTLTEVVVNRQTGAFRIQGIYDMADPDTRGIITNPSARMLFELQTGAAQASPVYGAVGEATAQLTGLNDAIIK